MKKYLKLLCFLLLLMGNSCSFLSPNREQLESSFKDNFGFKPPKSVKTIKVKNRGYFDFQVHYMTFTYNPDVMRKIIAKDQPLEIARANSVKFDDIIEEMKEDTGLPNWFVLPDTNVDDIYFKYNFLDHTFSEYYLWTNKKNDMTYLYVHFFD